jgi:hypothetical protein
MLKERPFTIYTNHKPVTFALGKPMDSNAATMFIAFHSLAHAGSQATKPPGYVARTQQQRGRLVPGLPAVLGAKASRQHKADVQPITIPARRFTHIHVEIVGHLRQQVPVHNCGQVLPVV